jgi:cell division protein FtsI (penicillin-binding protein 3)
LAQPRIVAGLNGYSSGGKTGTAQKIDVLTHRYSKTKYIASFVGIAPVNSPAISVAVIIDSPQGNHYGNANAAPVFREVAQEVLEYLGVPHDTNLWPQPKELAKKHTAAPELDDAPSDHTWGSRRPLRGGQRPTRRMIRFAGREMAQQPAPSAASELTPGSGAGARPRTPLAPAEKMPREDHARRMLTRWSVSPSLSSAACGRRPGASAAEARKRDGAPLAAARRRARSYARFRGHGVVVACEPPDRGSLISWESRCARRSSRRARPDLALQIVGSGIAREQVPAPGTMVPPGTEIVVRFTR